MWEGGTLSYNVNVDMSDFLMRELAVVLEDVVVHCAGCSSDLLRNGLCHDIGTQGQSG